MSMRCCARARPSFVSELREQEGRASFRILPKAVSGEEDGLWEMGLFLFLGGFGFFLGRTGVVQRGLQLGFVFM